MIERSDAVPMKIFIDPGHNYAGADTGATGNHLREQDVTFYIAQKLETLFIQNGDRVKMSRNRLTDNVGSSITESITMRCSMANDWGAQLFISIHTNFGGGTGVEALVDRQDGEAAPIAHRMIKALTNCLPLPNRGVKTKPDLPIFQLTNCPAVRIDVAFIDNPHDARLLRENRQEFAKAIFTGIIMK